MAAGTRSPAGVFSWAAQTPWVEVPLAAFACAGSGAGVATLLFGRSALFFPSLGWLAAALATWLLSAGLWLLGERLGWPARPGHPSSGMERWRAAAWPALALLPVAALAVVLYADDAANHVVASSVPTRQSLLAYGAALYGAAQAGFWGAALARRVRWRPAGAARQLTPPALLGLAAAAYGHASLYRQWPPVQTDLSIALSGAHDMLHGELPYHEEVALWADRVHLLPSTLVLLFEPLALLYEPAARLLFFFANQALWLVAVWLFIRRLVPAERRLLWLAGALVFGATYWPWQESIRYGQPDGLILLLFVLSVTAAAAGRPLQSGLALGLSFPIKPVAFWFPLAYALHHRWRALAIAAGTFAAVALATALVSGWRPWVYYFTVDVPNVLPGTVRGTNVPLASLHARFFVTREALSDGEPAPVNAAILALNLSMNLLGLLLMRLLYARRDPSPQRGWLLDAGAGLTLTLLLAPFAWQHYATWLTLAFLVLALPLVWEPLSLPARAASGLLAGAAFLLLSLEDGPLVRFLGPLLDRWPGAMALYPAGLLCLLAALLVARLGAPRPGQPPGQPLGQRQSHRQAPENGVLDHRQPPGNAALLQQ